MSAPSSRRKPINHGTIGGYRTHFRHGVPMCEPCRAAHRKYRGYAGPQPVARCGTRSGYNQHIRRRESPCEPCRTAQAEACREYKARVRGDAWPYELLMPKVSELIARGLSPEEIAEQLGVSRLRVGRARARAERRAA